MVIIMDIDSVLGDFGKHFLDYLGIEDKTPATEWDDLRFKDNFHLIEDDWKFWLTMPVLTDPSEIDFEISHYCTARPIPSFLTKAWLIMKGFPKAPVITVGHNGDKVAALKRVNADIVLDDGLHNYEALSNEGILCYLFTRPHNENYDTDLRVSSMSEFSAKIDILEKQKSTII